MVVGIDDTITPELEIEWYARDLIRFIQDARKSWGFEVIDRLTLSLSDSPLIHDILAAHKELIETETLCSIWEAAGWSESEVELKDEKVEILLKK